MSRFTLTELPLPGLVRVQRQELGDARGFLSRIFCDQELLAAGWRGAIAQVNHTLTRERGTVRGMHFQRPPYAETKLVSCLQGEVLDVIVDLRPGSPTFLRWHAEHLSADNGFALLVPQGCAHGFQTLSDDVSMLYLHSAPYHAASEGGLRPTDARLAIHWPLPIAAMSDRDRSHPLLTDTFEGVVIP
ncbi:MAG: dTDP-4-dehydrorhamnose 3,5-epimerase family protein [bacterium]